MHGKRWIAPLLAAALLAGCAAPKEPVPSADTGAVSGEESPSAASEPTETEASGGNMTEPPAASETERTEPSRTETPPPPAETEEEIIRRLGVDYRTQPSDYLMTFDNDSCDYWFIREGDTYHAYFLEFVPQEDGSKRQHIAHATSTDFLHWEYQGIVLYGWGDTWDDRNLATGSVARCGDTYYMLYTGHSSSRGGLGLAKSSDLYHWERVGDGPVLPSARRYRGRYEGTPHPCTILADPYLYPEAVDGWYYAFVNAWATDLPKNARGTQLILRTQNFTDWEECGMALLADGLDRLETAQVWEHGGRWYMSFGGRSVDPNGGDFDDVASGNYIYMADSITGPYRRQSWSDITYPEAAAAGYIQKQMLDPFGDEVMLVMAPYRGVLWPYAMHYAEDGAITFSKAIRE